MNKLITKIRKHQQKSDKTQFTVYTETELHKKFEEKCEEVGIKRSDAISALMEVFIDLPGDEINE